MEESTGNDMITGASSLEMQPERGPINTDQRYYQFNSTIHFVMAEDMESFEHWWNKTGKHMFEDHMAPENDYYLE